MRRWSIHQFYFYLVSLITLIMIIVGTINLIRAAIDFLIPVDGGSFSRYELYPKPVEPWLEEQKEKSQLPEEVITRELEQRETFNREQERQNSRNSAYNTLFQGISLLLVALPAYLYHWRRIPHLKNGSSG